jgi:phenylpropionate dioxygenase-like ring-hydroxylating dioxygenase large terminal subunit
VCRHRGAKVARGCGNTRLFVCPYHAWTYDLTGKVMGIPDERCFPGVRPERSSLAELPLCERYGLVWVIPTPAVDTSTDFDIDPWLGGLGPELASFGFTSWTFYDKRVIGRSSSIPSTRAITSAFCTATRSRRCCTAM